MPERSRSDSPSDDGSEFKLQLVFVKSTINRELRTTTWWHKSKKVSETTFGNQSNLKNRDESSRERTQRSQKQRFVGDSSDVATPPHGKTTCFFKSLSLSSLRSLRSLRSFAANHLPFSV